MDRQSVVALCAACFLLCPPPTWADRVYRGGVVATAYPDASKAALEMLDRGGNAFDAAVAAAFAAGVVAPYHNGIGGGGFALAYEAKTHTTLALDFRGQPGCIGERGAEVARNFGEGGQGEGEPGDDVPGVAVCAGDFLKVDGAVRGGVGH